MIIHGMRQVWPSSPVGVNQHEPVELQNSLPTPVHERNFNGAALRWWHVDHSSSGAPAQDCARCASFTWGHPVPRAQRQR